jgi:hypothetical protein
VFLHFSLAREHGRLRLVLHHDDDRLPRRPPPHINLQHHPCRTSLPPRNGFPVPRGRGTESRRTTASPSLKRRCPETLAHILSTHPAGGGEDGRSGDHRRRATSRSRHSIKYWAEISPKYGERTRKVLEHAIHEIYNHNASGLYFEELFWSVLQSSPPHPP